MSLIPSFFTKPFVNPFDHHALMPHHPHHPHNSLDWFDPFDELEHRGVGNMLHWFQKPAFFGDMAAFPTVPQKYRITVDCVGYKPESIKTDFVEKEHKLIVTGKEEHKEEGTDDFTVRHFKKTYKLPDNAIADKMVSFMAANGQLVIEVPLRDSTALPLTNLFPQIIDSPTGGKQVSMKFNIPQHINPEKVHVTIKDHDVIFRAEDEIKKPDGVSRFHYYQRTTLPETTQTNSLRCVHDKDTHSLVVTAPLALEHTKTHRKVPIERSSVQHPQIKQK